MSRTDGHPLYAARILIARHLWPHVHSALAEAKVGYDAGTTPDGMVVHTTPVGAELVQRALKGRA